MVLILLLLIGVFSIATIRQTETEGRGAAAGISAEIDAMGGGKVVVIITSSSPSDIELADALETRLKSAGHEVAAKISGTPPEVRRLFDELERSRERVDIIACTQSISTWPVIEKAPDRYRFLKGSTIIFPTSKAWPRFLSTENIRNIADRISVIAILSIGMTLVIITAGIDLSVGSFVALAAVLVSLFIQQMNGPDTSVFGLMICSLGAILFCGMLGAFSGVISTTFKITPFIATLAMLMIAKGLAFKFSNVTTIPVASEAFGWIGKGRMAGIPVSVIIMLLLYAGAYIVMHRTAFGRYVYAIGGNKEAAFLAGVPVNKVLLGVYTISGLLAGLGGVITASNLAGGAATYGEYYELYSIAAVVVGGTSLLGGEGKILGTLIGAFIIAVIQSGMNQVGIESNTQRVVFGLVIIGAILSDTYKRGEITTKQVLLLVGGVALVGIGIVLYLRGVYPGNY